MLCEASVYSYGAEPINRSFVGELGSTIITPILEFNDKVFESNAFILGRVHSVYPLLVAIL